VSETLQGQYDYAGRLKRAQALMQQQQLDGLYVTAGPNMLYFTGFTAYLGGWPTWLSAGIIPREGESTLLLSTMHRDILRAQGGSWVSDVRTYTDGEDPSGLLCEALREKGLLAARIGVEDDMWFGDFELIHDVAPKAEVQSARSIFNRLRMIKDPHELENVRRACQIADVGFQATLETIRAGQPEYEVAQTINAAMVAAGSETTRVGGHFRRLSDRRFERSDIVDVDLGGRYDGYHSDCARTLFIGAPTTEQERMYQVSLECFDVVLNTIRPGVEAQEVHRVAARFMEQHGYQQVWKIGHGVGLNQSHEAPYLQEGEHLLLEPGMVFTVDPGVFVSGRSRDTPIHVEDVVVVTEIGVKSLNEFSKVLIQV